MLSQVVTDGAARTTVNGTSNVRERFIIIAVIKRFLMINATNYLTPNMTNIYLQEGWPQFTNSLSTNKQINSQQV